MKEISLVLSGGAARGAYHLGVMQYIDEVNIKIKAICGTSIGAIIGTSYAAGIEPRKQLEIFKSKEFRDIFTFNFFRKSIFNINHKASIIDELLPVSSLEELNIPVYFTAVDLKTEKEIYYSSGKVPEICLASSALIPIFSPVEYDGLMLADGGIINHMPFKPLLKYSYPIIGINLHPVGTCDNKKSIYSFLKRAIYLKIYSSSWDAKNACDIYITNDKLRDYSLFSFKNLDKLFEYGYKDAVKLIGNYDKIKQ